MRRELAVIVQGRPAPQGSKRHVGGGRMVESSAAVGPWRDAVRAATTAAIADHGWTPADEPTGLSVVYTMARPAGHYRSGRHAHLLRDNAPDRPTTRPDLDKLLRSTLDALVDAGALVDDARVVTVWAAKTYPDGDLDALDSPGAVILLTVTP